MRASTGHAGPSTAESSTGRMPSSAAGSDTVVTKPEGSASACDKSGSSALQPRARAMGDVLLGRPSMAVHVPQDAAMKVTSVIARQICQRHAVENFIGRILSRCFQPGNHHL